VSKRRSLYSCSQTIGLVVRQPRLFVNRRVRRIINASFGVYVNLFSWKNVGRQKAYLRVLTYSDSNVPVMPERQLIAYQRFWLTIWGNGVTRLVERVLSQHLIYGPPWKSFLRLTYCPHWTAQAEQFFSFCRFYQAAAQRSLFKFSLYLFFFSRNVATLHLYRLYFNFRASRFYVNLVGADGRNYLSLSTGLFLKFFNNKKSLKKGKALKLLMSKLLRKLLITSNVSDLLLFVKGSPLFLTEILRFLFAPLASPFWDPVRGQSYVEDHQSMFFLKAHFIYFLKTVSYTSMKAPKRGRLKRKVTKRLVSKNNVMDRA